MRTITASSASRSGDTTRTVAYPPDFARRLADLVRAYDVRSLGWVVLCLLLLVIVLRLFGLLPFVGLAPLLLLLLLWLLLLSW